MASKIWVGIVLICVTFGTPMLLMNLNVSGYRTLERDSFETLTISNFNLLNPTGIIPYIKVLGGLMGYTIRNTPPLVNLFMFLMSVITAIWLVLIIRGGGN